MFVNFFVENCRAITFALTCRNYLSINLIYLFITHISPKFVTQFALLYAQSHECILASIDQ